VKVFSILAHNSHYFGVGVKSNQIYTKRQK